MFKVILMIAPTHISDRILINFDVNGYDTTGPDIIIVTILLLARIREFIHTRSSIAIRRLAENRDAKCGYILVSTSANRGRIHHPFKH